MILHDWFDWTNSGIGAVGLVLTLGAIWQATGAKDAAQQAGKSVRQHVAEVDFDLLMRLAKDLHGYVEEGRMPEARLRTTDLRAELAVAIRHHETFLGSNAHRLKEKQVDLAMVADGLNRTMGNISESERVRLLRITGAILDLLAGQCGTLRSGVDKEAAHG